MIIYSRGHMIATGRLPRDAEFRVGGKNNSHFSSFSIAADEYTDETGQKQTRWISVDAAFDLADAARNLKKSDRVMVCGKLETRSYTARDGTQKTVNELKADFLLPMKQASSVDNLKAAFPGIVVDGPDDVDSAFDEFADPDAKLPWEE